MIPNHGPRAHAAAATTAAFRRAALMDYVDHVPPADSLAFEGGDIVLAGRATAAPRQGKRGGYSNLGMGPSSETAGTGSVSDADDDQPEPEEEGEEADGGFVAAATAGSRRKKMSYVGLGDGGADSAGDEVSDRGGEEEAAAAAADSGEKDKASGRLAIFGLLNLAYVVLQLMGAMAFSSLALMSDGFHNLSDV